MSDNTSFVKTPPMGWNSWDCYGAAVNEETVRANAKFMAENLKQFGWQYIVVDIQWSNPIAQNHEYQPFTELCMDEYSRLIPAAERFPSAAGGKGFAPLAEYVHSLGLKFGIHIMRGIPRQAVHRNTAIKGTSRTAREIAKTSSICQWNTDMYGVDPEKEGAREYYDSIFELYKSWGVDFIKVDDICRELPHEESELVMLSESLRSCGRDMVLSLSPGAALPEKAELYKQVSNMWRITDDFWDNWPQLLDMFSRAQTWCIHAGAGHFPDADMLPVGAILQDYGPDGWTKFETMGGGALGSPWRFTGDGKIVNAEVEADGTYNWYWVTEDVGVKGYPRQGYFPSAQAAIDDALFSNVQFRTAQMAEFYSIINASYQAKEARSKSTLQHYMLLISLLSVVLALLFAYLYKQLRKLSRTKEELSQANLRLTQLNDELNDKNAQLSDSNDLKEQYIARFFDLCSLYIDKMDSYRKTLNRLAQNRQFDELFKRLKSTSMMENELDELYKNFDAIFLNLYPTFVADFNSLLIPEERIALRPGDLLNKELRIYALLRMGITDSAKIASFLRCSLSTVYNYRTKMRNKAALSREKFEKMVSEIGNAPVKEPQ